jgi:hypothetical protein
VVHAGVNTTPGNSTWPLGVVVLMVEMEGYMGKMEWVDTYTVRDVAAEKAIAAAEARGFARAREMAARIAEDATPAAGSKLAGRDRVLFGMGGRAAARAIRSIQEGQGREDVREPCSQCGRAKGAHDVAGRIQVGEADTVCPGYESEVPGDDCDHCGVPLCKHPEPSP